ncbi:hypothetical protein H6776_01345 [Candidatus Nomurabacteria bacterium]|nr:hypothetical protein [Candidatus Nomurabacteria bacterium]
MDNNHLYNLATQLTQEMKSLWRIEKHYIEQSESEEEKVFWRNMKNDKENHIKELKELVKKALG